MSDEQDIAEALDDDKIEIDPYDDELPADFPPDEPLGVTDIGVDEVEDNVRTRATREEPDLPDPLGVRDDADIPAEEAAMHEIEP